MIGDIFTAKSEKTANSLTSHSLQRNKSDKVGFLNRLEHPHNGPLALILGFILDAC